MGNKSTKSESVLNPLFMQSWTGTTKKKHWQWKQQNVLFPCLGQPPRITLAHKHIEITIKTTLAMAPTFRPKKPKLHLLAKVACQTWSCDWCLGGIRIMFVFTMEGLLGKFGSYVHGPRQNHFDPRCEQYKAKAKRKPSLVKWAMTGQLQRFQKKQLKMRLQARSLMHFNMYYLYTSACGWWRPLL